MKTRTHIQVWTACMVLLLVVLTGCQGTEPSSATSAAASTAPTAASSSSASAATSSSEPTSEQRDAGNGLMVPFGNGEELLIFVANIVQDYNSYVYDEGNFPIFDKISDNTGVRLRFESPSDYAEVLKTRLASGGNLPDLIMMQNNDDYFNAVTAGLLLKLNDYLGNMPNLSKFMEENEDARNEWAMADGSLYGISQQISTEAQNNTNANWIGYRKDWADKLGIAEPKTMDELEILLTAFRDGDPNGNSEADEIPFSCGGKTAWNSFANAYNLNLSINSGWSVENGTVRFDYYTEEQAVKLRAYLEKMAHWYAEKLIGNDMLTATQDTMRAQILSNVAGGISGWAQRTYNYNELMKTDVPDVNWAMPEIPETEFGKGTVIQYRPWDSNRFSLSSGTKDPVLTTKFLDYLLSQEGSTLMSIGIEGTHYEIVAGKPQPTQFVLDEMKNFNGFGDMISAWGGSGRMPYMRADAANDIALYSEGTGLTPEIVEHIGSVASQGRYAYVARRPLPEHQSTVSQLTDIRTYIDEVLTNIVIGAAPITEFDAMREMIQQMGIEDIIAVHQELYDLYNQ